MKQILIIDDDLHIGNMLEEALCRNGYRVLRAYSGTEALYVLASKMPDLVLLDLMLPGLDGEEVLSRIRGIPVMVVSAKVDTQSRVSMLLGGAVDYVTKPFDLQELLARIEVHLRISEGRAAARGLRCGRLALNPDTYTVTRLTDSELQEGQEADMPGRSVPETPGNGAVSVRLTRTECAILRLLMQNPTQVLPKSTLLERISEDTPDCTESSLKMHVSNLRRKLRSLGGEDSIEAVWGIGFRLKTDPEG